MEWFFSVSRQGSDFSLGLWEVSQNILFLDPNVSAMKQKVRDQSKKKFLFTSFPICLLVRGVYSVGSHNHTGQQVQRLCAIILFICQDILRADSLKMAWTLLSTLSSLHSVFNDPAVLNFQLQQILPLTFCRDFSLYPNNMEFCSQGGGVVK